MKFDFLKKLKLKNKIKALLRVVEKIFKKIVRIAKRIGIKRLLMVIGVVLLGLLVLIIFKKVSPEKTRDKQRIKDLKVIQEAAEEYYKISVGGHFYPVLYRDGVEWTQVGGDKVILKKYPSDPSGVEYGSYSCATGMDCNTLRYCVCAKMESPKTGNSDAKCAIESGSKEYYCVKNKSN